MAHKRLTVEARAKIVKNMALQASKESRKALFTEEAALFVEVRDFVLGKHKEAFSSLPESFVNSAYQATVRFPEEGYRTCYLNNLTDPEQATPLEHTSQGKVKKVPFPCGSGPYLSFSRTDKGAKAKIGKKLSDFFERRKELSTKCDKLLLSINAALTKITTTKRLKEEWPEAYVAYVNLFGDPEEENKAGVPMVPAAKVNAMIKDFPESVPAE